MPRTQGEGIVLAEAEHAPRSRRIRRLVAVLVTVALGVAGWLGLTRVLDAWTPAECVVTASDTSFTWAPDQASNAAAITAIALGRGLPARAATIAIATAMQESKVRNIAYGDRDSVGLFQQRPSQGWGTVEQIMNPEYSSNAFFDALIKVPGWESADIATAAQEVQKSADGSAYAQHEAKARVTASVLAGHSPAGIGCRLAAPAQPAAPTTVQDYVRADFRAEPHVVGDQVIVTTGSPQQGWAIASWAVARSIDTGVVRVQHKDREWTRGKGSSALTWHAAATPLTDDTVVLSVR